MFSCVFNCIDIEYQSHVNCTPMSATLAFKVIDIGFQGGCACVPAGRHTQTMCQQILQDGLHLKKGSSVKCVDACHEERTALT